MTGKEPEKTQREKLGDAARELGTDEREEAFDRIVKKITKAQPANSDDRQHARVDQSLESLARSRRLLDKKRD